jgi:hypothetical protein
MMLTNIHQRITLENLKLHEWIVGNDGFVFSAPMTPLPTAEEVQVILPLMIYFSIFNIMRGL